MKTFILKNTPLLLMAAVLFILPACEQRTDADTSSSKYEYESVEGDPMESRIYTLDNGLKVYLSPNKKEPRIQTYVAVRAGSKMDPAETTGLAHYLEHMMFKGTHNMGTLNWEKEKVLLQQISDQYEKHRHTDDPEEKKAIYAVIDSLSYEASKYAIPNEYDKVVSSLGAKSTNAYTWVEQTVYTNDIPSTELEKWLKLESNRFQTLVLRLFHTELETVYEEFNRGQDSDTRKSWEAMYQGLFPNHPYGTQTTIGEGEHLKNPSMVNIKQYFQKYYVPNNIAICLAGDLDPEKTIALIDEYFGDWERQEVEPFTHEEQPAITEPVVKEEYGVQPEHLRLAYRFDGAGTRNSMMANMVANILYNSQAGLVDLNLNQKQKVLSAYAFHLPMDDYSSVAFYAAPLEGQTLEEVTDLLLEQVEKVKNGDFEDWLVDAVVKNLKLERIEGLESNRARADKFVDAFIWQEDWADMVHELDEMDKITKQQIVDFANENMNDNYVVVYKRDGKDTSVHKVEKPEITPVVVNRDTQSAFVQEVKAMEALRLEPQFLDYENLIDEGTVGEQAIPFSYIENERNDLFELNYVVDMGKEHSKQLALAIEYLPYLGTSKYSAEELQKEFFKLGLSFSVNAGGERSYITLSGLSESFEEGVKLFEHILANVQPDEQAYRDLVQRIIKDRADNKKDKGSILYGGLLNYGRYGKNSPFRDKLSQEELQAIDPADLVADIKAITGYQHRVFYYGPEKADAIITLLAEYHQTPAELKPIPAPTEFVELDNTENKVYYVDYDMKQVEMMMMSKGPLLNVDLMPPASLFNEYFGAGLSSIVFQEIREQKALAYSAYAYFSPYPSKPDEAHYVRAYIGTQADKLPEAVEAMLELMNNMPVAKEQFAAAKDAALKKIESSRTTGSGIYWSYQRAKDRGLDYDVSKVLYEEIPQMEIADMQAFFNEHIKDRNYTFVVIGNKKDLDLDALEQLGEVNQLTLEELFGY